MTGISLRGRLKLAKWTVFGTLGCIAIAVAFNFAFFTAYAPQSRTIGVISAMIIPVLLAGPLFFFLTLKLRELAIANHKLRVLASTDGLTACLNRTAFTALVDIHLTNRTAATQGTMLVIDADHFKSINDRFGHFRGDEALKQIADVIRSELRKGDAVGRLGGEEFGVFLPGASAVDATAVAERIRLGVRAAGFQHDGQAQPLSISIGGASFSTAMPYRDLFRIADEQLYLAKSTGRDRVEMVTIGPDGAASRAATMH